MIRPEVAAKLTLWREALIGLGAVVVGLWLWVTSGGLPALFGAVAVCVGAILILSGVRSARFRGTTEGPGVVEVVEGRIAYLGPVTGGTVALDDLTEVAFRRAPGTPGFWRLSHSEGPPLLIPEGATGSERLLSALAPLRGLDTGAMVRAVQGDDAADVIVWRRDPLRALT